MNLAHMMEEWRQSQETTYFVIPFMLNVPNIQIHRYRNYISASQELWGGDGEWLWTGMDFVLEGNENTLKLDFGDVYIILLIC